MKTLAKDEIFMMASTKIPMTPVVTVMELLCHTFQYKPKRRNMGKFENDPNGYFDVARE